MSDNSKPTQNGSLSFELTDWLDHTQKLDQAATPGPWVWSEPDPEWTGDYYGVWERDEDMPPVAATHAPGEYGKADAEWIAHARTALPAAVAALRAVADLHQPDACWIDRLDCGACSSYDECVQWPCPTITAVTEALGEE